MRLLRVLLLFIPIFCYAKGGGGHGEGGHGYSGGRDYFRSSSIGKRSTSGDVLSKSNQDNSIIWISLGVLVLGLLGYMKQRKQEKLDEEKYK